MHSNNEPTIKAGYRLSVVSWENDGDNYRTVIHDGLTEDKVKFILKLLSLITDSRCNNKNSFGNIYDTYETDLAELSKAIKALGEDVVAQVADGYLDDDEEELAYQFADIVNDYTGGGDSFTRVVESITVELISEDVYFKDVSADFNV